MRCRFVSLSFPSLARQVCRVDVAAPTGRAGGDDEKRGARARACRVVCDASVGGEVFLRRTTQCAAGTSPELYHYTLAVAGVFGVCFVVALLNTSLVVTCDDMEWNGMEWNVQRSPLLTTSLVAETTSFSPSFFTPGCAVLGGRAPLLRAGGDRRARMRARSPQWIAVARQSRAMCFVRKNDPIIRFQVAAWRGA